MCRLPVGAFFAGFSLGLYDKIKGRDIDMEKCVVEWNHNDLAEVGRPSVVCVTVSTTIIQQLQLFVIAACFPSLKYFWITKKDDCVESLLG